MQKIIHICGSTTKRRRPCIFTPPFFKPVKDGQHHSLWRVGAEVSGKPKGTVYDRDISLKDNSSER